MDRNSFLTRCQKAAVQTEGFALCKTIPTSDVVVYYEGKPYYPMEYIIRFHRDGAPLHTASIKSIIGNSCRQVPLADLTDTEPNKKLEKSLDREEDGEER